MVTFIYKYFIIKGMINMLNELLLLGVFDRFQKEEVYSIQDYRQLLWEYQEYEAEILIQIAILSFEDDDVDEALESLEKARDIYEELGFEEKKADVLSLIGDIYLNIGDKETALKCYRECMELYSSTESAFKDDVFNKIKDLEEELTQTQFPPSEDEEEDVEEVEIPSETEIKTEGDFDLIFEKLDEIINLLEESGAYNSYLQNEKSLESVKEAYELASDLGDKKSQGILLLIMGDKTLGKKMTKKSMEYFNKALNIFVEINYPKGEAITHLFIGVVSFVLGDIENINFNFRKAIEIFRSLKDSYAESISIGLMNAISEV